MSAAGPYGPPVAVHQFIPTLNPRDATGSHTLLLRQILREAGWRSEIFAEAIHDDLATEAYKHWTYPEHAAAGDVAIYQFSTSSVVASFLAARSERLIVDFHNFTAPEHFRGWEPHSEERAARAHDDLALLAGRAELGLADSRFNERDLRRAGFRRTTVIPVLVDYRRMGAPPDRRVSAELAAAKARGGADLLFVGRIVPSKGQHEVVKALWAYRRLYDPAARLHLVGRILELRLSQGPPGLHRRAGVGRRRADHRRRVRRCAGGVLLRRRRLPVALGARGVRRAAGRGDGGGCPGGGPPGRCRG